MRLNNLEHMRVCRRKSAESLKHLDGAATGSSHWPVASGVVRGVHVGRHPDHDEANAREKVMRKQPPQSPIQKP